MTCYCLADQLFAEADYFSLRLRQSKSLYFAHPRRIIVIYSAIPRNTWRSLSSHNRRSCKFTSNASARIKDNKRRNGPNWPNWPSWVDKNRFSEEILDRLFFYFKICHFQYYSEPNSHIAQLGSSFYRYANI